LTFRFTYNSRARESLKKPRKKNVLVNYEKLRKLVGIESYDSIRVHYKGWIEEYLGSPETGRDDK
jgi:hypothetical protein